MFKVRKTVYLTVVAALTAVNILCNAFLTIPLPVNGAAISFAYIPCLIAGAFLGPLAGFTVGFTGDLLGALIRPLGPYNPIIGIASGLLGFIPGFIFKELKLKRIKAGSADKILAPVFKLSSLIRRSESNKPALRNRAADTVRIFVSFILTFVICTASLNTYATYIMYGLPKGKSFWAYFSLRLPWQLLVIAINFVLCATLFPLTKYAFEKVFKPKHNISGEADKPDAPEDTEEGNKHLNCDGNA